MIEKYLTHQPVLGKNAWVHERAVVIGRVTLGNDVSVWPNAVLRGDVNDISIGNRSNVQDGSIVHATHAGPFNDKGFATTVGEDVTIGHNVILHGCTIGNRVLIGMGSTILDGSVIPDDVVIGAGALVSMNKTLKSGYLYIGSPVKPLRELSQNDLNFLKYSADHYKLLKDDYTNSEK
ncbi:MAG: gamma carbonic anhydrase family protein [Gammaproteobacteria bacterium]|nr:MAG: gamma carbonic anhydrase family protein [Gammaproteobacteria bacterium]